MKQLAKKVKKKIILILVILCILSVYLAVCATKSIKAIGSGQFQSKMTIASYGAINNVLAKEDLDSLFSIRQNAEGEIVMISTNGLKMNMLSKTLAEDCLTLFNELASFGADIPLGAFSGLSFLSGYGKNVNIKIITINSVTCEFVSSFENTGINQTKQSLYLNIVPECRMVVGLKEYKIKNKIEFMCYENFIIGNVPNTYINVADHTAKN